MGLEGRGAKIKTWTFPSSSSPGKTYETVQWEDGSLSCECRGWTVKKEGRERSCTHTDQVAKIVLADPAKYKCPPGLLQAVSGLFRPQREIDADNFRIAKASRELRDAALKKEQKERDEETKARNAEAKQFAKKLDGLEDYARRSEERRLSRGPMTNRAVAAVPGETRPRFSGVEKSDQELSDKQLEKLKEVMQAVFNAGGSEKKVAEKLKKAILERFEAVAPKPPKPKVIVGKGMQIKRQNEGGEFEDVKLTQIAAVSWADLGWEEDAPPGAAPPWEDVGVVLQAEDQEYVEREEAIRGGERKPRRKREKPFEGLRPPGQNQRLIDFD